MAKENKVDLEKMQSISVKTGGKKRYKMDHGVIWDPDKDKPLVRAERDDSGDRFVETSDKNMQDKLDKLGYKPNVRTKLMHEPRINPGVKSKAQAEKDARG